MHQIMPPLRVEYRDGRVWKLIQEASTPFRWSSPAGIEIDPPDGLLTDFATIPRVFATFLSHAGEGRRGSYGPASVLHDWLYLCQRHGDGTPLSRIAADSVLRDAMRARGVGRKRAWMIWASVRLFGWIWWAWFRHRGGSDPLNAVMPTRKILRAAWWGVRDAMRRAGGTL